MFIYLSSTNKGKPVCVNMEQVVKMEEHTDANDRSYTILSTVAAKADHWLTIHAQEPIEEILRRIADTKR